MNILLTLYQHSILCRAMISNDKDMQWLSGLVMHGLKRVFSFSDIIYVQEALPNINCIHSKETQFLLIKILAFSWWLIETDTYKTCKNRALLYPFQKSNDSKKLKWVTVTFNIVNKFINVINLTLFFPEPTTWTINWNSFLKTFSTQIQLQDEK